MARIRCIATLGQALMAVALTVSCASSASLPELPPSRTPDWLAHPTWLADEGNGCVLFSVGRAGANPNRATQRELAEQQARAEMARHIRALVQGMVRQYMATHGDYYTALDATSAAEYTDDISRQVADELTARSHYWGDHNDPIEKAYFVRFKMSVDDVLESYRDQMTVAFQRELAQQRIRADADAFALDLAGQLARLDALRAEQLDKLLAGN